MCHRFGGSILPVQSSPGSQVPQLCVPLLFKMAEPEPETESQEQGCGVDISNLANYWENNRAIRSQLLESGSVTFDLPGKYHPSDTVAGVGVNLHTLMPLMPMLWLAGEHGYGQVGMVTIPALENEFLGNTIALQNSNISTTIIFGMFTM